MPYAHSIAPHAASVIGHTEGNSDITTPSATDTEALLSVLWTYALDRFEPKGLSKPDSCPVYDKARLRI